MTKISDEMNYKIQNILADYINYEMWDSDLSAQAARDIENLLTQALADQRTQLIQAVEDEKYPPRKSGGKLPLHAIWYNKGLDDAIKLIEGKE